MSVSMVLVCIKSSFVRVSVVDAVQCINILVGVGESRSKGCSALEKANTVIRNARMRFRRKRGASAVNEF